MEDISIGEIVKLRKRKPRNPNVTKEIEAAKKEAQRWREKLIRRRERKRKVSVETFKSEKKSLDEVSLASSALLAQQAKLFKQEEFSIPGRVFPSFFESSQDLTDNDRISRPVVYSKIRKKRLELLLEPEPIFLYFQKGQTKLFGVIRSFDLTVTMKIGNFFKRICRIKLDRQVVNPLMTVAGETLLVLDVYKDTEKKEVNLFVFSMIGYEGELTKVTNCATERILGECDKVQDFYRCEVTRGVVVIVLNVNGRSRAHLVTFHDDLPKVEFLGFFPSEVRQLSALHGADRMFLCFCDSRLIIFDLNKRRFLSKPISLPPSPSVITGVVMVSNILIFVNYDGISVLELSVFEDDRFQVERSYQIGYHGFETLSLVAYEDNVFTFVGGSEVLHLNLSTLQLDSEQADNSPVI